MQDREDKHDPVFITYEDLIEAIADKNHTLVHSILNNSRQFLFQNDSDDNTLLHIAAKVSDEKTLTVIMHHLGEEKLVEMAKAKNAMGNTPFHIAVEANSYGVSRKIAAALKGCAETVARQSNYMSEYPLQLLQRNGQHHTPAYEHFLEELTIPLSKETHADEISTTKALNQYASMNLKQAAIQNIKLGCQGINFARTCIQKCSTHPCVNLLSPSEAKSLIHDMNAMQTACSKEVSRIQNENKDSPDLQQKIYDAKINMAKLFRTGNCEEMAYLAASHIREQSPESRIEIYNYSEYGDHAFVVIGRHPESNPCRFSSWNEETVICDPLSGKVFLAKDIPRQLPFYWLYQRRNNTFANVFGAFNERCHTICPHYEWPKLKKSEPHSELNKSAKLS